jgi:hypothetical protein
MLTVITAKSTVAGSKPTIPFSTAGNSKEKVSMYMRIAIFLILAILLVTSNRSYGAPTIAGTNANKDGSITVQGQNFGVKTTAAPLLWENFEQAKFVPGQYLNAIDSSWVAGGDNGAQVIACPGGGKCIQNHIYNTDNGSGVSIPHNKWANNMKGVQPSNEMYYSYKLNITKSGAKTYGVAKFGRIMTDVPGGSYNSTGTIGISSWLPLTNSGAGWLQVPSTTEVFHYFPDGSLPLGSWVRQEMYAKKSAPGVADGAVYVSTAGKTIIENNATLTCDTGKTFQFQAIYLPMSVANTETQPGTTDTVIDIAVDDIYVDNTRARVELCDNASWQLCMVKEIQIPVEWSSTQIKFQLNTGRLSKSAYLYVIDSDGNVNSSGYQINIPSGILPPPTNLKVIYH